MPPDKPKPSKIRFFLCTGEIVQYADLPKYPDSHIIGHLCYVTDETHRVTALARWEQSASAIQVPPLRPQIDCMIIGDVRLIKCRHPGCNRKERWEIGKAAFLALMTRYGIKTMDAPEKP